MREFGGDRMEVLIADAHGNLLDEMTLAELLPRSFGPEDLEQG
jgi:cytidine deaminase